MALLTKEQRIERFKALGYKGYSKDDILKFQKKAFPNNKEEWDSKYGKHTDIALRHFYNCSRVKNFEPEEFRCNCGKCNGYPTFMRQVELRHLQKIRNHYKKPMTITSGLRCKYENERVGGVSGSGHLKGYAADFYMKGVTDTVANRQKSLKWIVKLPHHEFTYGAHMKDSNGLYRDADGMGNAMHTETHKPPVKTKAEKSIAFAKNLTKDDTVGYVKWIGNNIKTQICYICHHLTGKYKGANCIRFVFMCWFHGGGIPVKHEGGLIHNQLGNRMYQAPLAEATKMAQEALGCKDIKVIRNKNGIPKSKLKPNDACMVFCGKTYAHMTLYIGNGMIAHAQGSSGNVPKAKQVEIRKMYKTQMAIRYTGK